MCGIEVSSTQVSQRAALLDEQLEAWRQRPLGRSPYLRLDAHYEKVRRDGQILDAAVLKAEVAADIGAAFNVASRDQAEALLTRQVQKHEKRASRLANWMETNIPEGPTVFSFPATYQRCLHTTNGLERLNREVRWRSRVATLFNSKASCLRLATAIAMEISDNWETGRFYLSLEKDR